jgi:hypothetical protein
MSSEEDKSPLLRLDSDTEEILQELERILPEIKPRVFLESSLTALHHNLVQCDIKGAIRQVVHVHDNITLLSEITHKLAVVRTAGLFDIKGPLDDKAEQFEDKLKQLMQTVTGLTAETMTDRCGCKR